MKRELRWKTIYGEYGLLIKPHPWKQIEIECTKAAHNETGGVLIGYYTEDESMAVVKNISGPPKDSLKGNNRFRRGIYGLKEVFAQRWLQPRKTYYLGEWHYHPVMHIEPSTDDIVQMVEISQNPNYHCREPIMIIVGKNIHKQRTVRAFVFPQDKTHLEFQNYADHIRESPDAETFIKSD